MRLTLLLLMGGILLLSACGEEESDPVFSFSRTLTPDARSNGDLESILAFETDLEARFELVAGDGRACVLTSFLYCWGRNIDPRYKGRNNLLVTGTPKMLSIGDDHVCTFMQDLGGRRVDCAGSNSHGQNTDPLPLRVQESKSGHWLTTPIIVASGSRHNCALDAYGVYCWGDNNKGQTNVPVLQAPRWVAAGGDTSCAIDDNAGTDELICWGDNEYRQTEIPNSLTVISKIAVGGDFVCVSNLGQVECWGNTADWSTLIPIYTNVVHISAGKDHVCILNETQAKTDVLPQLLTGDCFGNDNDDETLLDVPVDINTNIRTISAGNDFTCASNMYSGYALSPDEDESGDIVYDNFGQAIYSSKEYKGVLCWGKNDEKQTQVPKTLCLGLHSKPLDDEMRTCQE